MRFTLQWAGSTIQEGHSSSVPPRSDPKDSSIKRTLDCWETVSASRFIPEYRPLLDRGQIVCDTAGSDISFQWLRVSEKRKKESAAVRRSRYGHLYAGL